MKVNVEAFNELMKERNWSLPKLAEELGVDYSYLFRVVNGKKGGGNKLFSAIYAFCAHEGLRFEDYVFLSKPLSIDNNLTGTEGV